MKLLTVLFFVAVSTAYNFEYEVDCDFYQGTGCCYNGVEYSAGDSWPSELYCLSITCYKNNHTISNGCSGLYDIPEECISDFKKHLKYPSCCPTNLCEDSQAYILH